MLALSDRDVWAVGSPEGESELDVSRDGGNSFQEIALAAPKEIAPAYLPTYHLPVFIGPLTGYEPVTYRGTSGSSSAVVLFATADGGRTWSRDRILTNLAAGENDDSTVAGSQWIVPLSPRGAAAAVIKLPSGATIPLPAHKVGALNRCRPGFVTPSEGWMNCSGELLATIDGGATWSGVTPHARNGILTTEPVSPRPSTPMQVKTTKLPRAAKTTDPLDIPAII
jgi:photosystem II stability/assembly factor-like uncharacterized protein